ncbi:MAG: spore germination protein GerW family protein [Myxococcota bacterium]
MNVQEMVGRLQESLTARRVFGEPIQQGDAIIVPAAKVRGGGGGGEGEGPKGEGTGAGSGFGLSAVPTGAFVFKNGEVTWRPAVDVNRLVMGAQILLGLGIVAFLLGRRRSRHGLFARR